MICPIKLPSLAVTFYHFSPHIDTSHHNTYFLLFSCAVLEFSSHNFNFQCITIGGFLFNKQNYLFSFSY